MINFLRKLWPFVRPYRTRLALGAFFGIVSALVTPLLILSIKVVVDLVFNGNADLSKYLQGKSVYAHRILDEVAKVLPQLHSPNSKLGVVLVICTIPAIMMVRGLAGYLSVYMTNWSSVRAVADIRTKLFNHLQNLSLSFFSQARTGDLISRIVNDTQILNGIIGTSFSSMVKDPITVVANFTLLMFMQAKLTLISLIVLPACIVPITIYARKVRKSARAMQGHISDLTGLMHESFTGNRIIKAYNLEDAVVGEFRSTTQKYIGHTMRVVRANELPSQLTEFLGGLGVALVLIYVSVSLGEMPDYGQFTSFILAIVLMYPSIKTLTRLHNQLNQAEAASHRIFELLDMKSSIADPSHPVSLKAAKADIHFEGLDFDYGEKPLLRDINLTVKAGQLVALVGSSGSGKTTITNLLLRFYDPQKGAIRIGQTDIRDVALKDLRSQMALVTQETILFHDTIRTNIALGRPDATPGEVEAAARAANAHDFIVQQAQGYETHVGEKGVAVSGGQRQRIAIARAIVKDAPILILDEATSALDSESERVVQAELEKLMVGRTTVCIAHRLSTIQKADLIVVMSEGRIVETGTHAELLQRKGVYQRLYELQFNR